MAIGAGAAVGTIAAAPLHILRRGGEPFYGGAEGLLPDTLGSLVRNSAYDPVPPDEAVWIVAAVVIAWVVALALAGVAGGPAGRAAARMPAPLFAVIALVAVQLEVQHHLLGTPYLVARTALFLLPLLLLAVVLTADGLAALGRGSRLVVTTLVLVAGAASAAQLMRSGNLSEALDWREDAVDAADAPRHRDADPGRAGNAGDPGRRGMDVLSSCARPTRLAAGRRDPL